MSSRADKAQLGQLQDMENIGTRDAVHVAVVCMKAYRMLNPGDRVEVVGFNWAQKAKGEYAIGIVDPFLTKPVNAGECVYVVLYPGTVTNLRHDWDHPDLPKPAPDRDDDESYYDACRGC